MLLTYTLLISSGFSAMADRVERNQQLFSSPCFMSCRLVPSDIRTGLGRISYNTEKPILGLKILYINAI